jgi:hypothetical protein
MRAAIRGDFERLARRRGGQELMQDVPDEVEAEHEAEHEAEPGPVEPAVQQQPTSAEVVADLDEPAEAVEPQPSEPAPEETEASDEQPPQRKGFFARLLDL